MRPSSAELYFEFEVKFLHRLEHSDQPKIYLCSLLQPKLEALTGIEDGNLEDKYRWEQGFTLEAYTIGDSQESRDAFVEKRDAKF